MLIFIIYIDIYFLIYFIEIPLYSSKRTRNYDVLELAVYTRQNIQKHFQYSFTGRQNIALEELLTLARVIFVVVSLSTIG